MLNSSASKGGLLIFPSPAKGNITVESLIGGMVSIYDDIGKKMWFGLTTTKNKEVRDARKFLSGNYIVQLVDPSTGLRRQVDLLLLGNS